MIYQNLSRLWLDFTGVIAKQTTEFKIDKNPKNKNINLCCLWTSKLPMIIDENSLSFRVEAKVCSATLYERCTFSRSAILATLGRYWFIFRIIFFSYVSCFLVHRIIVNREEESFRMCICLSKQIKKGNGKISQFINKFWMN